MVTRRLVDDNTEITRRIREIKENLDFLFETSGEYQLDTIKSIESDVEDDSVPTSEIIQDIEMILGNLALISDMGTFLRTEGRSMEQGAIEGKMAFGKLHAMSKRWK